MAILINHIALASPLFTLILFGYVLARRCNWGADVARALSRFVFSLAIPALLFKMMAGIGTLPKVDIRLLLAFFGSCLIVFVLGRLLAWRVFRLDGSAQSIMGMAAVFSNNVLLGIPLVKAAFGQKAMPSVALVLVFNALTLWTLVTISVEWSRQGAGSLRQIGGTVRSVLVNPIIVSILAGVAIGLSGWSLPAVIDVPLGMLSQAAAPVSLLVLGMGLAGYSLLHDWKQSMAIVGLKLVMQPLVIWLLARAINLPPLETRVIVALGSLPTGSNAYLAARQFGTMEGPVASGLALSTAFAIFTTPVVLTLLG